VRIEALCARHQVAVWWKPFLLGGLLKAARRDRDAMFTVKLHPSKSQHNRLDVMRWADVYQTPFQWHPRHPVRSLLVMRALIQLADPDTNIIADPAPIHALYHAMWVENRDMDDGAVVAAVLNECGRDGDALVANTQQPAVKARLRAVTDVLVGRGAFGAPTLFVQDRLFWGQDRLHFVEAALKGENL